jgi:NAD(P)-dependent dehydrogenase (short-subunit alcohol dehydrogenase family)
MKPKVILITGSSRGLGAHAAYHFASKGHSLHIRENHDLAVSSIPAGRLGSEEDIFNALDFMVSGSSCITGQNIMVDGGCLMR